MRAKLINPLFERPMEDILPSDIITKDYISELENKQSLDYYVNQYIDEEEGRFFDPEEDPKATQEIIESEDFKNWIQYELETRMDSFKDIISQLSVNNKIPLYRVMTVDPDFIQKMKSGLIKRLGIYWAYDEDKAEAHWGYGSDQKEKEEILLNILINEKHVNWIETFRLNLEHEFLNDEAEIRLFKNTPIRIENIIIEGADINEGELRQIQQYTFKA